MLTALYDRLEEDPDMYQDEMVAFLAEEFDVQITKMSVSRASPQWDEPRKLYAV
jgi:hypothetical protein